MIRKDYYNIPIFFFIVLIEDINIFMSSVLSANIDS